MRIVFLALLFCCAPLATLAADLAANRYRLIAACATVENCLQRLGSALPERDTGSARGDEARIATILKDRFGRAARNALLEEAVGDHDGWRSFSGAVLMHWHDWDEDDIPLLNRALSLSPGGWIARPLGEIGTPAAIEALVEDLIRVGGGNQTSHALITIGPKVLPQLLPVLGIPGDQMRRGSWHDAATLIKRFGADAAFIAGDWAAIAADPDNARSRRVAALRGLAVIGEHAAEHLSAIRSLRNADDRAISAQAIDTLVAMRDPAIAEAYALSCRTTASSLNPFVGFVALRLCLQRLAEFGQNGQAAGPDLLRLLGEASVPVEQAYIIEALGLVNYRSAGEPIEAFLSSQDWRVVYASVRSLGQLGRLSALDGIRDVETRHWLPEVKELARAVGTSLETGVPFEEPHHMESFSNRSVFGNYNLNPPDDVSCASEHWKWDDREFNFHGVLGGDGALLRLGDGELFGTNLGEFMGALEWRPDRGEDEILVKDNVVALLKVGPDVIAVFALAHMVISYGYAIKLERGASADWVLREIARFPAAANRITEIGANRFAAAAGGRIVVFTSDGIEGLAACAEPR